MSRPTEEACSAASEAIAGASLAINQFVREVRESRSEFDAISSELHSLDGVLDLLRYDAPFFSPSLAEHTPEALATCVALVGELEGCVTLLNQPGVSRADKKSRWLASRGHIDVLRWTLREYKLVLGLAADLVGV
jgi:GTPase-activating protein SAC7